MTPRPADPTPASTKLPVEPLERRLMLSADGQPLSFGDGAKATYTDADGGTIVVSLKGPGTGAVSFAAPGNTDATLITLDGTTGASSLSIKGDTGVAEMRVNGSLKSIAGKTLDLRGPVNVSGGLSKLQVDDVFDAAVTIGPSGPLSVAMDEVSNSSLTIGGSVKSLKVTAWSDFDRTPDVITASSVASVAARGDFGAGIVADSVGKVNVKGILIGSEIRSAGAIASVTADSIDRSAVFAGVTPGLATLPASAADFANPDASIGSVTMKTRNPRGFADALIAAPTIGRVSVGAIASFNGLETQGVAARQIGSFTGSTNSRGRFRTTTLENPADVVVEDDFVLRIV